MLRYFYNYLYKFKKKQPLTKLRRKIIRIKYCFSAQLILLLSVGSFSDIQNFDRQPQSNITPKQLVGVHSNSQVEIPPACPAGALSS